MTEQHQFHPNDPSKQKEHMALLDLVPDSKATHVAVNNGSWFDANTWKNGQIPDNQANVVITDGVQVTYDGESEASLQTLRVDGQLDFATDKNTKMEVDTFVVSSEGTLTIGTETNPIQANKTARIIIADNGAIDTNWDPQQLSRGIISHGNVQIHGQEKDSHLKLAQDAMTGDQELVLAEQPLNWKVGDTLVLTGTNYVRDQWNGQELVWQGTQDEEIKIAGIEGNRIILDSALKYDHDTPQDDLKASVANYTRNVVIETENAESLPANQRGHVMFMHSDNVDVRYAEFHELGRTDKSELLDDFALDNNGSRILDANGEPKDGDRTNVRGRYAVHFHQTGVDQPDSPPAIAVGNAVWGSPGWGYVHHDSHVVLEDNAAYNVFGAAFVTETGNETGAWVNNIAIKSEGKLGISKSGTRNHDIARNGTGFWFQGRLVENEDNIAAGQRHGGMTYLLRGEDQKDVLIDNLTHPEIARYQSSLDPDKPEINGFKNGEVFASGMGLEVIKANPRQQHDVRSVLDGFKAWEVHTGTHLEYTSKYTLNDFTVIATESKPREGISIGNNAEDMVINNPYVEGFDTGITFTKHRTFDSNAPFNFVVINPKLVNNDEDFENFDPKKDQLLTQADLKPGTLKLELSPQADFVFKPDAGDREAVILGTKTDSIGEIEYPSGNDFAKFKFGSLKNRLLEGHYEDALGTKFITVEELIADRVTGELIKLNFVVTLDDSWNESTLGGILRDSPFLGVYEGNVEPGFVDDDLQQFLNSTVSNIDTTSDPDPDSPHSDDDHTHSDHEHEEETDDSTDDSEITDEITDDSEITDEITDNSDETTDEITDDSTNDSEPDETTDDSTDESEITDEITDDSADDSDEITDEITDDSADDSETSEPDNGVTDNLDPIRVEAEDMELDTYRLESSNIASNGSLIRLPGSSQNDTGKAVTRFEGPSGNYDVVVGYFDENDGIAQLEVKLDGVSLDSWMLDQKLGSNYISENNFLSRTVAEDISIEQGEVVEITGIKQAGEFARVDYLEFVPSDVATDSLTGEVLDEATNSSVTSDVDASEELILNRNSDSLLVPDFVDGQDIIQLAENLTFDELEFVQSGDNTLIQMAQTDQLLATLEGVSASSLNSQDFAIV
ncbi:G8 domain-containing protein [Lyngbya sp. PCC 8106]|uniref:G8 domain-containing protein n=1 Tax=Lyngbya sp. (strain PCC 8106) TaxID=313612 RepID=UPI0000EAB119|nr:G8 domain-containing protein [Lyngbya sp. PCC 8106]EAW39234.1 fructose-bisphosphate aldolase [Lyngbya sp. PCC 8106]